MPQYRNTPEFIVAAIEACWQNASTLSAEAHGTLSRGNHALALSLAVLSLEEIGKLIMADGLLFARAGDERSKRFEKGLKSHKSKLDALEVFPLYIQTIATLDPRYFSEKRFRHSMEITLRTDEKLRADLAARLGVDSTYTALDSWKQKGFYVHAGDGGSMRTPPKAIPVELAQMVVLLSRRLVGSLDFLFRDNLGRYGALAAKLRNEASDSDRRVLRESIEALLSLEDGDRNDFSPDWRH